VHFDTAWLMNFDVRLFSTFTCERLTCTNTRTDADRRRNAIEKTLKTPNQVRPVLFSNQTSAYLNSNERNSAGRGIAGSIAAVTPSPWNTNCGSASQKQIGQQHQVIQFNPNVSGNANCSTASSSGSAMFIQGRTQAFERSRQVLNPYTNPKSTRPVQNPYKTSVSKGDLSAGRGSNVRSGFQNATDGENSIGKSRARSKHRVAEQQIFNAHDDSSEPQQHPHRVGRVRYNRQFSTALQIMSCEGDHASATTSVSSSKQKDGCDDVASTNRKNDSDHDDNVDDNGGDEGTEELLSYIAFRKTG